MNDTTSLAGDRRVLAILERVGGSLSLLSVVLILMSYTFMRRMRTEPNTFIVFMSASSALGSIACLVGNGGALQGAQGFLLDMCVYHDLPHPVVKHRAMANSLFLNRYSLSAPLWSLALAIHLLAVFSKGPEPVSLRKWGGVYCLVCYGGPFAVGLAHLDLTQAKTAMAGGDLEVCFSYKVHLISDLFSSRVGFALERRRQDASSLHSDVGMHLRFTHHLRWGWCSYLWETTRTKTSMGG
jgi:hypothetical protein